MRNALLAKVHIARKELALDEESYRALLKRITGKVSAGDLRDHQLDQVLMEFKRLGWKPAKAALPAPAARDPQSRMIRGMWIDLGKSGQLVDRSEKALRAWIENQVGASDLRFCDAAQKRQLIEQLKRWSARVGIDVG
ncbi:gp16 family protein [Telmatospirillum sp. J64-1]|uniref:gp16 family protein n=1 Tax=Telmatospirillum sp. J64-1 TaxID=2502183 RepID=UPI00163DB942|nr:regulatory protein GemA [Telmatospirillum sp. J64-1]